MEGVPMGEYDRILDLIQEQFKEFRIDMKSNLAKVENCIKDLGDSLQQNNEKQIRMAEVCVAREKDLAYQKREIEKLKIEVRPIKNLINVKNLIIGVLSFIILLAGAISASKAIANNFTTPAIERSAK